jgi:hypothetical protein
MRIPVAVLCLSAFAITCLAQTPPRSASRQSAPKAASILAPEPSTTKDLPVRKVVLYKNGVGYFEHAGSVTGNQRVAIDFTSSQLNDVLQSLTVLDEGGGRIGGVNYNSTTPLAEQLKTLSLGMTDDPTSTELFQALRGQRVEVTGAPGGIITGRLLSIESRTEKTGSGDTTVDKFYLTVVAGSGAVRVIELTPTLSVRPLDNNLQGQLDRYLELLSSTRTTGLRHLTLNALGQGQRQLRVSYISEVPVWKSTYRIVFPHAESSGEGVNAIVQGWAVVDNTVGSDWDNVQLSLVAGAPQSFIQPLSQPLYTRRPEIPLATGVETTPQTHEAADTKQYDRVELAAKLFAPPQVSVPGPPPPTGGPRSKAMHGNVNGAFTNMAPSVATESVTVAEGTGSGGSLGTGGGVYRATDAISQGDVSTNAFDDFFEYALTQPVTIHKNESAMVPILQQELPAEHVTLWNPNDRSPLRAVWLENKSKLTLDSGSFSIFESGEFAGEGLLDPIHPGEKRLLSYATDQAIKVNVADRNFQRRIHHVSIHKGSIVETFMQVQGATYSANNTGDVDRTVLIEHPRHTGTSGWTLDGDLKAAESTPNLYRLRLQVPAHNTAKVEVREHGPEYMTVNLQSQPEQREFLLELVKQVPDAQAQIQPVIDAQAALTEIDEKIAESKKAEETAAADEARDRENVTALKGSEGAKRFVDELNRAEDQLQATRKQTASLQIQRAAASAKLDQAISNLSFDWNATETK